MRFFHWDEDNEVFTEYRRLGECNHCGACCRAKISFRVAGEFVMGDSRNGGTKTNGIGIWNEISPVPGGVADRIFFQTGEIEFNPGKTCEALDGNLCKVHGDPDRKLVCQLWPVSPDDLLKFPDCGYSFEKVDQCSYNELKAIKRESSDG